jgi:hypothetical protein
MVLVDRDGWEAERVQGGYRSAWQRNRDGKVRAVDLYSRVYYKENELIRAGMKTWSLQPTPRSHS